MSTCSTGDLLYIVCNQTDIFAVGLPVALTEVVCIVPIYILVIYLAAKKWHQQRSFRTSSHADIFTFHVAAFRLIWILALGFYIRFLNSTATYKMVQASWSMYSMMWYGEIFIHVLTCVEQYLAVVHPIVYRGLRNARGVRIRNISLGCVWLLASVYGGVVGVTFRPEFPTIFLIPFAVSLVVISFCCVSVLSVLIRPGPGEKGRVDQSKQRAFYTIAVILLMLWVWLSGIIVTYALYSSSNVSLHSRCMLMSSFFLFNIPSALVLPVLYLHRAGKPLFFFHKKG